VNERFGEELTLAEILSDEEKAEDNFLRSKPGENFGPELTYAQALDILFQTTLPPRARFWEMHEQEVREAISHNALEIKIDDYQFKIEYFARITSVKKFEFSNPMTYMQFSPSSNGKGSN
jgi:hypothetical protein